MREVFRYPQAFRVAQEKRRRLQASCDDFIIVPRTEFLDPAFLFLRVKQAPIGADRHTFPFFQAVSKRHCFLRFRVVFQESAILLHVFNGEQIPTVAC